MIRFKVIFLVISLPLAIASYQAQASHYKYNLQNQMFYIDSHYVKYAPTGELSQVDTLKFINDLEIQGNITSVRFGGVILRSDGTYDTTFLDGHNTPKTSAKRMYSGPYGMHKKIKLDIHNNIQVFGGGYSLFGLEYMGARWYYPEIKRFGAQDSFDVANRFNIDSGNPIMNYDPSGHLSTGGFIMGAIGMLGIVGLGLGFGEVLLTLDQGFVGLAGFGKTALDVGGIVTSSVNNKTANKVGLGIGIISLGTDIAAGGLFINIERKDFELEKLSIQKTNDANNFILTSQVNSLKNKSRIFNEMFSNFKKSNEELSSYLTSSILDVNSLKQVNKNIIFESQKLLETNTKEINGINGVNEKLSLQVNNLSRTNNELNLSNKENLNVVNELKSDLEQARADNIIKDTKISEYGRSNFILQQNQKKYTVDNKLLRLEIRSLKKQNNMYEITKISNRPPPMRRTTDLNSVDRQSILNFRKSLQS